MYSSTEGTHPDVLDDNLKRSTERGKLKMTWPPSTEDATHNKTSSSEKVAKVNKPKWPPEGFAQEDSSLHANNLLGCRREPQGKNGVKEKNNTANSQQNQHSSFSSLSEKEATNICKAKKNGTGNNGKGEMEAENVQDKLNKRRGSQNREENGKGISEGDNVTVHSAGKEQEKKVNLPDGSEVVQVTNIDDVTVQKHYKECSFNNNNNNNATFSSLKICRQEKTPSAVSNAMTALSHAICRASQHAFTKLEKWSGNEDILEMYEPSQSYSGNTAIVVQDEQNSKDKGAATSKSLAQWNKDAACQKSHANRMLALNKANTTAFSVDTKLVCTGEESKHDKNILADTLKTSALKKDSPSLDCDLTGGSTKNSCSPYSEEHGNCHTELNDINACQESKIFKVLKKDINTSLDFQSSRSTTVPPLKGEKVKFKHCSVEEQIKRDRFYDEHE